MRVAHVAIPQLTPFLNHGAFTVRAAAVRVLGRFGSSFAPIDALRRKLTDGSKFVYSVAPLFLLTIFDGRIGPVFLSSLLIGGWITILLCLRFAANGYG